MTRNEVRSMIEKVRAEMIGPGEPKTPLSDEVRLSDIDFHSLEFSEVAMDVEHFTKQDLNFDARPMREVATVGELIDFLLALTESAHHA